MASLPASSSKSASTSAHANDLSPSSQTSTTKCSTMPELPQQRREQSTHSISSRSSNTPPSPPSIPVTPETPTRGRLQNRYPSALARGEPGRVPLHKRGKSKTYECLEDLLREAGYKETRVFTPEMERAEARAEERKLRMDSMRIGVGAVVDFLAGWIPGANKADLPTPPNSSASDTTEIRQRSLPPSPLSHKRRASHSTITTTSSSSTNYSSSTSPTIRHKHIVHDHHHLHHEPHHLRHHHHEPPRDALPHANLQRLRSRASASDGLRTYAQVSAARGYLRHMASTPNMPKTRPSPQQLPSARRTITLNGEDHVPPMPSKWLQSVTKAVLGTSATGPYFGDPSTSRPSSRLSARTGRSSRSTGTRTRVDPSILVPGANPSKMFTAYMQRSKTAPSKVTTVRVLCRSAPASRSSSRSGDRVPPHSATSTSSDKDQRRGKAAAGAGAGTGLGLGQSRKSRSGKKSDGVPTLANIRIEGDSLGSQWYDGRRIPTIGTTFAVADDDDGGEYYEEEEDEGEVDLARLLVPPKRQRSIRSLRRHLHRSESARGSRRGCGGAFGVCALDPWTPDDEEEPGTRNGSMRERGKRGPVEGGEEHGFGWEAYGGPGFEFVGTKRRRGIPGAWSNIGRGR